LRVWVYGLGVEVWGSWVRVWGFGVWVSGFPSVDYEGVVGAGFSGCYVTKFAPHNTLESIA